MVATELMEETMRVVRAHKVGGPDVMMVDSPLQADKFPFYMFNDRIHSISQRGYSAVKWLEEHKKITVEEMKAFAVNTYCPQYDRWVKVLDEA